MDTVKAYRDADTGLLELKKGDKRVKNSPLIKRFEAAIAWPSLMEQEHYREHWFFVMAEKEDGTFAYAVEEPGDLQTIGQKAIEWKDRLLISRIYTSDEHSESLKQLRNPELTDGLCMYGSDGTTEMGLEMWWHEKDYWPYFRDRDTYCPIIVVPRSVQANVLAGYNMIRRLFNEKRAGYLIDLQIFSQIITRGGPLQDVLNHPLLRAAAWVTTMMERDSRALGEEDIEEPTPWYSNPAK
jgi:hypothetical protein